MNLFPEDQSNIWAWSHNSDKPLDPSWRAKMEQTAELRFVWEDSKGWHQVQGHSRTQYYGYSYMAKDLTPIKEN